MRAELAIDPDLPARNGAQRQRASIADGATPHDVYAATVRETEQTYATEVPAT